MTTLEIVLTVIGALIALVAIPWTTVSIVAGKIAKGAGKVSSGADTLATVLEGFGMEKVPMIIKEGPGDIGDEVEDLAQLFAERTADGNLTKEDLMALFKEGKEGLWVEMKDFRVKVFPKKALKP